MKEFNDLEHPQLAVVTGASSGIGYELAKVFAKNGFDLIMAAENAEIFQAAESLKSFDVKVESIQVDLRTPEGNDELYHKIKGSNKPISALAINAGVGLSGEFMKTDLEREISMVNLNIISALRLTKRLLPDFEMQGHGRILYTSSIAADAPGPYYAVYAATKSFIQSFAEALRQEVKDKNIFITALQPGPTDTNFFERAEMMDTKAGQGKKDDPADVAQQGFDALMAGKDHVVAGSFKNKVQSVISKVVPETQAAKIHEQSTKPLH